jgi:glutamate/tyrosine decarboxylase-like PLP-dependent enzyme
LKNLGRDLTVNAKKDSPFKRMFLDPEGDNFPEFENNLVNAVKLLRLWWKSKYTSSSPRPSEDEVGRLISSADEQSKVWPLTQDYRQVESCVKLLYRNLRFNEKNMMNVHPSPLLPAVVGSIVAMLQNPNNLSPLDSPATTLMERECVRELARLVGFNHGARTATANGNLVSCGTISNLTALLAARVKACKKAGYSERNAMCEVPRGIILTSASAHYSIRKAAWILGIGEENVVEVPVADNEEVVAFEESLTPFKLKPSREAYKETLVSCRSDAKERKGRRQMVIAVVTSLGTISTGTIEPIRPALELRDEYDFHLHVDGAIGGFALCANEVREKASGVEEADSITVDPHKLGYIAYPCSAILFRNRQDSDLIAMDVPYVDSRTSTIEGSRPGSSSAALWVALKTLGLSGYNKIIDSCISLTRKLAMNLRDAGYQILHEIDLNVLCFSLYREGESRKKLNVLTDDLYRKVIAGGRYLVGKTEDMSGIKVRNKPWEKGSERVPLTGIRVWIMNPYTSERDIEAFVDELDMRRKELAFT